MIDSGNTSVLNFIGELSYNLTEKLEASAKLELNTYSLSSLEAPLHRPGMIFTINGAYNIQNKVRIDAQINYISGLKGYSIGADKIVDLNNIFDLNIGLDYKLSDNFSTFVKLNNLTNSDYSYYLNYQNQKINALVGLTYSF